MALPELRPNLSWEWFDPTTDPLHPDHAQKNTVPQNTVTDATALSLPSSVAANTDIIALPSLSPSTWTPHALQDTHDNIHEDDLDAMDRTIEMMPIGDLDPLVTPHTISALSSLLPAPHLTWTPASSLPSQAPAQIASELSRAALASTEAAPIFAAADGPTSAPLFSPAATPKKKSNNGLDTSMMGHILTSVSSAVVLWKDDGEIVWCNQKFRHLLATDDQQDTLIGFSYWDFTPIDAVFAEKQDIQSGVSRFHKVFIDAQSRIVPVCVQGCGSFVEDDTLYYFAFMCAL